MCIKELLRNDYMIPAVICIGENLQILKNDSGFVIDGVYVDPTGRLIFRLDTPHGDLQMQSVISFVSELRLWTAYDFDRLAKAHYYNKSGIVQTIIDVMSNEKLLSKSDRRYLMSGIDKCLAEQSFILLFSDGRAITGDEFVSAA